MTVKKTPWVVIVLLALSGGAFAGLDMEFVDGLETRGYYRLAVEHLEKMRGMMHVGVDDRALIPLRLGGIHNALAARERESKTKEAELALASGFLEEFSRKNPRHPKFLDVSLLQVDIQSNRAQARQLRYKKEDAPGKKRILLKETDELYGKALGAAKKIVEETTAKEKEARRKWSMKPKNRKLEKEFWFYYSAQVRGIFLLGHIEYLWAQLYPERSKQKKPHLDAAVKHFETASARTPKTNVTFEAHVRRGMCLRELAVYGKNSKAVEKQRRDSIKAFDAALTVESNARTKPTRAEAHYQKAVTAMLLGEYETVVAGADGFLTESPLGKSSYRGQTALLIKSEALGKLAHKQLTKPKDPKQRGDWEDTYNRARAALRDVTPRYRKIRQQADELIQSWTSLFPKKAEVVISPLIAASEAQQHMRKGEVEQAIDKYREVIDLSSGIDQFAVFEQEAWKTLGNVYLKRRRLYMATIAWRELLTRFPDTTQGAEICWARTRIFAWLYTHSTGKDDFDLDAYFGSLQFFIAAFPKDSNVFKAQTEIAKVYALQDKILESAEIWGATDPGNPRYAECMLNAGELYRQAFIKLAEAKKGSTTEARGHLDNCAKYLGRAGEATLPATEKENYNTQAMVRLAEILVDDEAPGEYARSVPNLLARFRERFPDDRRLTPRVMLAAIRAFVRMKQFSESEKLALELEKEYEGSESYGYAAQLMVVTFQTRNPPKANEWRKKQIVDPQKASDLRLANAAKQSWKQKDYDTAIEYYEVLEKRMRQRIAGLSRRTNLTNNEREQLEKDRLNRPLYERSLAAVYFDARRYKKGMPLYRKFLTSAREAFKKEETRQTLQDVLGPLAWLAESEEEGGEAKKAIKLWKEYAKLTFRPPRPPKPWYNARNHIARCYYKLNRYNDARRILKRVEVFYQGFDRFPDLKKKVDELKAKLK